MIEALREIISDHIKYWKQIFRLAKSDMKKGHSGSTLGWAWEFASPAVRIAVYVFAFSIGLRQNQPIGEFSYFYWLLAGIIVWFFAQKTYVGGAGCIKKYKFLVTKIKFPVSLIPSFTSLAQLFVHMIIVGIIMVIFVIGGHFPTLYWLQLPVYMLVNFLFACSWGLFAGVLSTMSKDFQELIRSTSMAIFWLSGIFFSFEQMPMWVQIILNLNPVAVVVRGYRNSLITDVWFWNDPWLLECLIVYAILTLVAVKLYKKLGKELPDVL